MPLNLGKVLATPAAIAHLTSHDASPNDLLHRHLNGDWADICLDDKKLNDTAVRTDGRILSAYVVASEKFYVITERDHSYTTVMLAAEY